MECKEGCAEVICLDEVVNDQQNEKVITRNAEFTFEIRESLLTTQFRSLTDIRALYNWILGIFIIYFFSHCINYVFNSQDLETDINLLRNGFRNFGIVLLLEIFYVIWSISQWSLANSRAQVNNWLLLFIQFVLITIYIVIPIVARLNYDMSFAIGMITTVEQIRISMKVYSFWIESAKIDQNKSVAFCQFIYFWFAPTFLFRLSYPRAKSRSWFRCLAYIFEFLACIFVIGTIARRALLDGIWDPKNHPIQINDISKASFELLLAATFSMLLIWYLLFHCWLNAWAEALKFGDRYFYGPWWLISSANQYYRHWNPLVHQWLKFYVYFPMSKRMRRTWAFLLVIGLSSIIHEYCISFAAGFFLPFILGNFLASAILCHFFERSTDVKNSLVPNLILLTGNSMSWTFFSVLFGLEIHYRSQCVPISEIHGPWDFFVPRIFCCIKLV